ncbi:response regulator receiver modulated diguanylate cyclase [Solidesulfovibrio fructosivorans JJ]]|uniref:diguanylate cyclase n=1 Tax=Solidesulfovibrio fructosivorans JJ] TaxID=596151 RepID=E1JVI2_SOLFR|nr:diguanylate cyclase [Solidesulfovibrio fructosivorans]EFL51776.1 response regulator receiver modulated diguanylate cyclase [Solidesulfovibrio fructosivorans JJ]]
MTDGKGAERGRGSAALLAEGNPAAREVLATLLASRFETVHTAANLEEALEARAGTPLDMALVAANLPGGAASLAMALRRDDAPVPVFLTGAPEDILAVLTTVSLPGARVAVRPFDPASLGAAFDEVLEEIAAKRLAEEAWDLTRHLLDDAPQPMAIVHAARVVFCNRALLRFMGLTSFHEFTARGLSLERFLADAPPQGGLAAWMRRLEEDPIDREHRLRLTHPDRPGQPAHVFQAAVTPLPGRDRRLLTLADVTELELERRELLDLANLDPLTRALNRRKLADVLTDEAARADRYGAPLSVVLLDIDHFKAINDTHGHEAGDAVLVELAGRLRATLRQVDRLARFGGEEFVVVAPGVGLEATAELAERLRQAVADKDFAATGRVTASFGVAERVPGEDPERALGRADKALYRAKNSGRNRVERDATPLTQK